jgi:GT2 family glycosyltransferase
VNDVDVSLVLVAHRSSAVLPAAIAAFRGEAAASGVSAETVVVEHSEDAAEVERAASAAPDHLQVRPNRGFAAGVNAGVAVARGRRLLVGNPDVELMPGALAPLLSALAGGWGIVGPQFELAGFRFPPADVQRPGAELARRLLPRPRAAWRTYLRHELRRWRRVWEGRGTVAVPTLSGALLAGSREAFARLGPWDEDYFLYFEETDWLRRAGSAGVTTGLVSTARASHRWGHSAAPERWERRFAQSRARFYRRHHPWLAPLLLALPPAPAPPAAAWREAPAGEEWRWLLSPSPAGFPAALHDGTELPDRAAGRMLREAGRTHAYLVAWRPANEALAGPFRVDAP